MGKGEMLIQQMWKEMVNKGKKLNQTMNRLDSVSSQGEATSNEDSKVKRVSRVPKKLVKKESKENSPRSARSFSSRQIHTKLHYVSSNNTLNKSPNTNKVANAETVKVPSCSSSEMSEETDDKAIEDRSTDDKAVEG